MLTSPSAPSQDMGLPPAPTEAPTQTAPQEPAQNTDAFIKELDTHLNNLPPEALKIFEDGFKEYPKLPEVLGTLMPEAYEYFKTVQGALTQQNSPEAPTAQAAAEPTGNASQPLLGGQPQSAKATSFKGMNP